MRILHLVNHCNHGHGNAHVAIDLVCFQAAQNDDVIYASAGGDYVGLFAKFGARHETIVQNVRSPVRVLQSLAELFALCRRFRPDIIHAHMMASAVYGYAVAKLTGARLVTTVHNSFDRHSRLMRLGDKVVAVSQAERSLLLSKGYQASQVVVVINGPNHSPRDGFIDIDDTAKFSELVKPFVMTVCGLHQRKGVHDLIRGFADAASSHPDWKLYIVGDGPDRQMLVDLASSCGMAERVRFFGSVGTPQPMVEKADIFVLASYADPCSLAVAEARGAGCAIVATAVGGTPELLEQGRAGQLVSPGAPAEIATALKTLMADRGQLEAWRVRSKTRADYLNVARVVDDYRAVYSALLKS